MKKQLLLAVMSMVTCFNMAHAQNEQFVEIVSTKDTGTWRLTLSAENSDDESKVWVDLNHNGKKDDDESIGMWEWLSYSRPRTGNSLRVYGPVKKLSCSFNDIKEIHAENNSTIQELECTYSKDLTSIDLSSNLSLKKVNISGCKLTSVKLPSKDARLEFLDVNDNELKDIDVSGCPELATLHCFTNKIAAQEMHRLVVGLADRSDKEIAGQMFVLKDIGKPEVNEILKSTVLLAKQKNWKVKYFSGQSDYEGSDHSLYSDNLPKAMLISSLKNGAEWVLRFDADDEARKRVWIDFNGNGLYDYGEEQVLFDEEVRFPLTDSKLTIYGDLNKLSCRGLALTTLDVAGLTNLKVLDCSQNTLDELKLNTNVKLTDLLAYQNKLDDIDISGNVGLSNVSLNDNKLRNLSLSENKNLSVLFVSGNELEELNVSACPGLVSLACENNKIKELNLAGNTGLETFYCGGNLLSALDLSALKNLWMLSCEKNGIESLKLPKSSKLERVYCYANRLKGSAMTGLCQSLPMREPGRKGMLVVVDTKDETEGNECYSSDVQTALGRNWQVYDYRGNENGGLNPYEGIATGIDSSLKSDDIADISYINAQGMVSRNPFKGVNIVVVKDKAGNILKTKKVIE